MTNDSYRDRRNELIARLKSLLPQFETGNWIPEFSYRFQEYLDDPESVSNEWRDFIDDWRQLREEFGDPPEIQIPRLPGDPHIKPKDDEAFRLFMDEFYDA